MGSCSPGSPAPARERLRPPGSLRPRRPATRGMASSTRSARRCRRPPRRACGSTFRPGSPGSATISGSSRVSATSLCFWSGSKSTGILLRVLQVPLLAGALCGTGLLAKRAFTPRLRGLSCPDDYLSNLLATAFVALAFARTISSARRRGVPGGDDAAVLLGAAGQDPALPLLLHHALPHGGPTSAGAARFRLTRA